MIGLGSFITCASVCSISILVTVVGPLPLSDVNLLSDTRVDECTLLIKSAPVLHLLHELSAETFKLSDTLHILFSLCLKLLYLSLVFV